MASKTPEEMAEEYANDLVYSIAYDAFLAGYKAAKDQLADAGKVMCNTTMEEVQAVDTGELMPITNLPTPAKWISVKDRLPEEGQDCIFYVDFVDKWDGGSERINFQEIGVFNGKDRFYHRSHTDLDRVTHWMPLPAPPKEEK